MRVSASVLLLTAALSAFLRAQAQNPGTSRPSFEVVAVKLNKSGDGSTQTSGRDNSFTAVNVTVRFLILAAYNLIDFQLTGGPGWIDTERYDVTARTPEGIKYDRVMLQSLLEERFKLALHTEIREQLVYGLVLLRSDGRLGPQLKPSTQACDALRPSGPGSAPVSPCYTNASTGGTSGTVVGVGVPIGALARALGGVGLSRHVIDRTGLTGTYDYELQWSSGNVSTVAPLASNAPDIFVAVQEQLGLKLEAQRGPVEFTVVDRIDRPTPD